MDRTIMYRIWDNKLEKMVDTHMHVIGESFCCGRIEAWIREHDDDASFLERYNDMVLMEYTGLRDTTSWSELTDVEKEKWYRREDDWKGKYIWEGDIIKGKIGYSYLVKYNNQQAGFIAQPLERKYVQRNLDNDSVKNKQVIGNKFENKDMMLHN